jgi:hypothetical protein
MDLVSLCFNCLCPDHIATICSNVARCLRCRGEGHQAWSCKRPRLTDVAGPTLQQPKPIPSIFISPSDGDFILTAP